MICMFNWKEGISLSVCRSLLLGRDAALIYLLSLELPDILLCGAQTSHKLLDLGQRIRVENVLFLLQRQLLWAVFQHDPLN